MKKYIRILNPAGLKVKLSVITILLLVLTACTKGGDEPTPDPTPIAVSSVKLNKASVTLSAGETIELIATITPENATDKTVTWTSSNTSVATVANGMGPEMQRLNAR